MYISLADFKRDIGAPALGTTKDAQLTDFIERAQDMIERHCRRKFEAAANTTRTILDERAIRGRELWLDQDLATINTITNGDGTVIASGNYVVIPTNAIVDSRPIEAIKLKASSSAGWTLGDDVGIVISGKWAYSLTPPESIVQATFRLAHYFFQQKDNAADIDRPVYISAGGSTTVLPPKLPDDLKKLLAPFVRSGVTT